MTHTPRDYGHLKEVSAACNLLVRTLYVTGGRLMTHTPRDYGHLKEVSATCNLLVRTLYVTGGRLMTHTPRILILTSVMRHTK
jgi:hypothetical protein